MVRKKHDIKAPLLYAEDKLSGELIPINQAQPKHTHLICPSPLCQWPVTPVLNTTKKIKHYRHKPSESGAERECKDPVGARESIVHLLAKAVISKRKSIYVYAYMYRFERYRGSHIEPIKVGKFTDSGRKISFENVEEEVRRVASDYQPDITGLYKGQPFVIEVHYQHEVDEEKLEKIRRDDVPAVEISLGHLNDEDINAYQIEAALRNPANVKWLHYPASWMTDDELKQIASYEKSRKGRIDSEIRKEEQKREAEEKARLAQIEWARKEEERQEAIRLQDILRDYIGEYLDLKLQRNELTPFTEEEQRLIRQFLPEVTRVGQILTRLSRHSYWVQKVPTDLEFRNAIRKIGSDFRAEICDAIAQMICQSATWEENYLIKAYRLGMGDNITLNTAYNYRNTSEQAEISEEYMDMRVFIRDELLPYCDMHYEEYLESLPVSKVHKRIKLEG
jgi:hypothetical protein